ncbi:methionyl-tRNA formyltransferase [Sphingobacterium cellulitidis]|uniref:methionyl-tRNA formyltransferase n=1 Tax=Sphingobacterium cellulitidis TaxID=1768011 RepID=UPI000B941BD2|nr:methionyl-tRNA formyltransferase [Sphingobacterium cellulitidis]OYD44592.1 methionyl-tRNA formyltransferase [Sphingobacterium cellulitidis]
MRIIFMGTPDFAVASLKALIEAGEEVVAVVTGPDKPAGRGQKMHSSAVKQFAVSQNIPVLQPVKLRDPEFLEELKSFQADLQVVVAFRMLPEIVWNMPPKGTINVHASLLPNYRGAAPINHAILNGEKSSGVTTFLLQHEIDTGNILFFTEVPISETDNAGDLHDKLMVAGAELLIKTVNAIKEGNVNPIPQDELSSNQELKHAPKIFKEDCLIDWGKSTEEVFNQIRGLSPYPAAFTYLDDKVLKIYSADKEVVGHSEKPGSYISDGKTNIKFATADGFISLSEIQIEGKKRMAVTDFLRGYRLDKLSD